MKNITDNEQKSILIDMLKYIHDICVENNINYSLIGGSLIGAVREKNIIPWDDDVDIVLLHDEYKKLLDILKNKNSKYKLFTFETNKSYYYPYAKLVDSTTVLEEDNLKKIEDYGVFIDIFSYNEVPNNKLLLNIYMKKILFLRQLITGFAYDDSIKNISFFKKLRNKFAKLIGIDRILKHYNKHIIKYNNKGYKNLITSWPIYGINKELQSKDNFIDFDIVPFANINAMISSNYDKILTKTFGNYMTRPSKDKQVSHHSFKMYWK